MNSFLICAHRKFWFMELFAHGKANIAKQFLKIMLFIELYLVVLLILFHPQVVAF